MKIISLIILNLVTAFTISCSRGGADSSSPAPAGNDNGNKTASELQTKFPNKAGTVFGMWTQNKTLNMYISENTARIESKCQNKTSAIDFAIQISGNTIKILESKKTNDSECPLEVKKDETITFKVNGDQLVLSAAGEQDLVLTRMQSAPVAQQPSNPQSSNPQPGNNNSGTSTFELYTGSNCTGTMVVYTAKMNCQALAQSPAIHSAKFDSSCAELDSAMSAEQVCQVLNQQVGNN
jgi:hypothetical protein